MSLEKKIVAYLREQRSATAKEIAKHLRAEKSDVNSVLYSMQTVGDARISVDYVWALVSLPKPSQTAAPFPAVPGKLVVREPTPEQIPVISAGPFARIIVEAGPGTGKTETLVLRLKHLVRPENLRSSNILVLSFSVAAVKELKSRIARLCAGGDNSVAFVEIRTFDSFASRLLRQVAGPQALRDRGYDERIVLATRELQKNPEAVSVLRPYKHVLLDEMQDLVGVRAEFALALLTAMKPAFTLFGDSAQGIYDFQIRGNSSALTSARLLSAIRKSFPETSADARLTRNFRTGGNPALESIAVRGRQLLLDSPDEARAYLESQFAALKGAGTTATPDLGDEFLGQSTCVVCGTNGEVLRLAGELNKRGIPFEITRDKNEYDTPAWLGRVFLGWPDPQDPTVRRQPFVSRVQAVLGLDEARATELWHGLLSVVAAPKAVSFRVEELRTAIVECQVLPTVLPAGAPSASVKLSTIHRSKGREFDNVVVVMKPGDANDPEDDEDAVVESSEAKVLFVALTRARKSLHRMESKTRGVWKPQGRWVRSFTKAKGFNALNMVQVGLPGDIDVDSFASGGADDVARRQQGILSKVAPGSAVELCLTGIVRKLPVYGIRVGGSDIGLMSSNFGRSLAETLRKLNHYEPSRFPQTIREVWVREIVTSVGNIGDENENVDRMFRTSGLWLTPALEGLGYCDWKKP